MRQRFNLEFLSEKRTLILMSLFSFVVLCCLFNYSYNYLFNRNFNQVLPNKIYRSAQPTLDKFKVWNTQYHIQSILNLRGADIYNKSNNAANVLAYANQHNINVHNIELSSTKVLSKSELNKIISIIENSTKPLLIHCKSGSDRTGLVSAVSQLLNNGSVEQASSEFRWSTGFLPFRKAERQKLLLSSYKAWLDKNNLQSSSQNFKYWVATDYKPWYYSADIKILDPIDSVKSDTKNKTLTVQVTNTSNYPILFRKYSSNSNTSFSDNNTGVYLAGCYISNRVKENKKTTCWDLTAHYPTIPAEFESNPITMDDIDYDLMPGESISITVPLPMLSKKQRYTVEYELIDRASIRFSDYGNNIAKMAFDVI